MVCKKCGKPTKKGKDGTEYAFCYDCNQEYKEEQQKLNKEKPAESSAIIRVPKNVKSITLVFGDD